MLWPVLMVLQNVLIALFVVSSRHIATRFPRAALPLNIVVFGAIGIGGMLIALSQGISTISLESFNRFSLIFILAGLCFAITNTLSYIVLQYVDAAIGTLLATFNIIAAVIFATLVIDEGLGVRQLIGGFVVLLSMYVVLSLRTTDYHQRRIWLGVGLSILACLFYGVATTSEKYLLNHVTLPTYLVFGWGLQFVSMAAVCLAVGKVFKADFSLLKRLTFWRWALPAALLRVGGGILFVVSLRLANNLSIVSVFTGFKVLLTAIFAAYLLGERENLARKYEAAMLAVAGIAIMLWQ